MRQFVRLLDVALNPRLRYSARKQGPFVTMQTLIGWLSAATLLLASALVGYSIWFCAGALKGDVEGCFISASGATLSSPPVMISVVAAVAGLIYSGMRPRR